MSPGALYALPLKRTHSPAPDNTTVPSISDDGLAKKRLRLYEHSYLLPKPCPLEELPAEILQQIFFTALNGNLLRASPRIASKLSDQAVYRTAFFVAFYHKNLVDLRDVYKYLLPEITTQIPYWELRSMVKVVLDSRWCTWGWFKELYFDLLEDALLRFERVATKNISETSVEMIRCIRNRNATLHNLALTGLHGENEEGQMVELACNPYDICIRTYMTDEDEDEDEDDRENPKHWRLSLFAFGTIPMDVSLPRGEDLDQRPFRSDFSELFGLCGSYGSGFPSDLWACLEGRIFSAVQQNDIPKLRKRLQIDYFLHPEDMPYKVSPRLFRIAADTERRYVSGKAAIPALTVLFDLDPSSLPCESSAVEQLAKHVAPLICDERADRSGRYSYFKQTQASDNPLSEKAARDFVRRRRVKAYVHAKHQEIIRYMKDGVVKNERNLLSPSFDGPVFDDDIEKYMIEEDQYLNSTLPSRQYYLNKTVPELRDELINRGIRPYSVGTRKSGIH